MEYDVVVIGGGHAGCEAALAAARLGVRVLLLAINLDHVAQMSCNPAVGGIAKGQLVREVDAMGGAEGVITDLAAIQFRMLNRAKGAAVHSPRSQCDKTAYQRAMKLYLELTPNLDILQSEAIDFIMRDGEVVGVATLFGDAIYTKSTVIAAGTFLSGTMHFGLNSFSGGRAGDPPSSMLSTALRSTLGLELGRLKTGTPPRVLAGSVDFSAMDVQPSEPSEEEFSFWPEDIALSCAGSAGMEFPRAERRDMPCYMTHTTEATAQLVRDNLDQAPLYQGLIKGIGTRYCPSFEDKVVRFAHHKEHLLYLEPEGASTGEYYINGISTSLPPALQRRMLAGIPGLENAKISRYAYAIEYDFVWPHQTSRSLALKRHSNVFVAGQINGSSGYEEAAGQGLIAGLNAARFALGRSMVEMSRSESYIGVMIDDLTTKEIIEPYRLFTSRAEYRLRLRQDNADLRLSEFAHANGLLPDDKYAFFVRYREILDSALTHCRTVRRDGRTVFEQLKRMGGECDMAVMRGYGIPVSDDFSGRRALRQIAIMAHYDGYLQREEADIRKLNRLENWTIPADFDYEKLNIRNEAKLKLSKIRPSTLAQASRIDGVTPVELALLQLRLGGTATAKTEDGLL